MPGNSSTASLGGRLKLAREARHLTQAELAARAGVQLDTLRAIEQGRTANPGVMIVLRLADVLDTTVEHLVRG